MRHLFAFALFMVGVSSMQAAEPSVSLKLVAKKDSYAWPVEQKPEEFAAKLKEIEKTIKGGMFADAPPSFQIDFVLQFTNTGTETVEIVVKGDPNLLTLDLTGPGVMALSPPRAMTREFRLPQAIKIEAGKSFEMPLKQLSDGMRGISRSLYYTAPGEYKLTASYQVTDAEGNKTALLKSKAEKFTVKAPE